MANGRWRILLVVGAVVAVIGFLSLPDSRRPRSSSIGNKAGIERQILEEVATLEAQRAHLDETVWAADIMAERHEAVFIRLWDQLRSSPDPTAVLQRFSFGKLVWGEPGNSEHLDHNIQRRTLNGAARVVSRNEWSRLVEQWKADGFRLEQSEWRHPQFEVLPDQTRRSRIFVRLHIANETNNTRHVVRGDLKVEWKESENGDPVPATIDATGLEYLTRSGDAPFHHAVPDALAGEHASFLEPMLQCYDLDGDGLSEIILARRNRVFWNRGQGTFRPAPLFDQPLKDLSAGLIADFDGDGVADFLAVDADGSVLFRGDHDGRFRSAARRVTAAAVRFENPLVVTAGDIDGDGDLDVWAGQYKVPYRDGQMPTPYFDANDGYPAFLLVNDGLGNFVDGTRDAGLSSKRYRRSYSASFVDLDDDNDLDLMVVSDFTGVDLYRNNGRGQFTDATGDWLTERRLFGMAHTFGDFDGDGGLDFLVVGMNSYAAERLEHLGLGPAGFNEHHANRGPMSYGNRLYLRRSGNSFVETEFSKEIARSGWSWGASSGDFDNDGDVDVYIVNGHISGASAADYETQFWRHDIYTGDSRNDAVVDAYFQSMQTRYRGAGQSYGGHEINRLFLNRSSRGFAEAGYLMGVALEKDCRNAVADDLDGDGKLDLLVTTMSAWPQPAQELHLFANLEESERNWIGVRLREAGAGFSPVGAKVILRTAEGQQVRQIVTGDSYRSQHAPVAHFGLGMTRAVVSIEVIWPNGERRLVNSPAINRYHDVRPGRFGDSRNISR